MTVEPAAPPAWRGIVAIAGVAMLALAVTSGRYGYHRDELYFIACGRHLAWGYPDQPSLVPLIDICKSSELPSRWKVTSLRAASLNDNTS